MAEKYLGYSPYGYVVNNPIVLIDPNGMEIETIYEGVKFTGSDAKNAFQIISGQKKNVYMAIEGDPKRRANIARREQEVGNGQWAVLGASSFASASNAMDKLSKYQSLDNFVLETHGGHFGGSFLRVNDKHDDNPDSYIYNNELTKYLRNGESNTDISYLKNMASKVKSDGNFILAACIGIGDDSQLFGQNLRLLTGKRLNIFFPKDFVNPVSPEKGEWAGARGVNSELRVDNNAGWFHVLPSGKIKSRSTIKLSITYSLPVVVK